jgi:hypothetical protein
MNTKFSKICAILGVVALMAGVLPACAAGTSGVLTLSELTSHPADYNGKIVTFDAFIFTGFEISALSSGLTHPAASDRWTPVQPLIWLSGNIPQTVLDRLYKQSQTPSGYDERYGKIRVTGKFEYGAKYGHLDSYDFRLTATDAAWIDWTPVIK